MRKRRNRCTMVANRGGPGAIGGRTNMGTTGPVRGQRKLRASERRDEQMAAFCERQAKAAKQSTDVRVRADVGYWLELAAYYRNSEQYEAPKRRVVPNTRRLEFLARAADSVLGAQREEIAYLRSEGVSWADVGDAFGVTRQAAAKRWAGEVEGLVVKLAAQRAAVEAGDEIERAELAAAAGELEEALGVAE